MKNYFYAIFLILFIVSCKKDNAPIVAALTTPTITSQDYIDSLLFVNKNGYQILTTDTGARFSSTDSHIQISAKGLISRITSAEVAPIVITWSNQKLPKKTIYALGATDDNQDMPFKDYQGVLATNAYDAYVQGWKTLQKLPIANETYTIMLRHADASIGADNIYTGLPNWWKSTDSNLARQLNQQGIDRATVLGQVFKDLGYPIKRVVTSEFWRARQTATLVDAGPTAVIDSTINHLSHNLYAPGIFMGMVGIVSKLPVDNQMTLVVSHHPINELAGNKGFPSFPDVAPFNWTGAYFVKQTGGGNIQYEGAVSWGMFKCWRDLKLHKAN